VPKLSKDFLEAQTDYWVSRLYEFLSGQESALRRRLDTIALIRLTDGSHIVARENGRPKAFLPSNIDIGLPTVREAVCATTEVRDFLRSLGIVEPDPIDHVVGNILPKYRKNIKVGQDDYATDIERILAAFSADSTAQKEKLKAELRDTNFVMAFDTCDGEPGYAKPGDTYIATDRLQQLFAGVSNILMVDNTIDCLRGEPVRNLLVSCGASRYLKRQKIVSDLSLSERERIRRDAGLERAKWESPLEDFTLRGLTELLEILPKLKPEEAANRAKILWEALTDLETGGTADFFGSYTWGYSQQTKTAPFDASFIRTLNHVAWVPSDDGTLLPASLVVFDTLGWKPSPFLQTKIAFSRPIIDQLAKLAGFDPAALDLLRRLGITSVADLTSRLGIKNQPNESKSSSSPEPKPDVTSEVNVYDDANDLYGDDMPEPRPGTPDPDGGDGEGSGFGQVGKGPSGTRTASCQGQGNAGGHHGTGGNGDHSNGTRGSNGKRTPGHAGGRPFISYVGTHPDESESDPDGLDQVERMRIEGRAIDLIIRLEPSLRRASVGNSGFDLFEADYSGRQIRWVEVKAMTGNLNDRPVGMSHTQFQFAQERGDRFWLYIVEYAADSKRTRILRIRNPAALARTFTFDKGWTDVAQTEPEDRV
jgi:Domain of unknown function (DUF3883)